MDKNVTGALIGGLLVGFFIGCVVMSWGVDKQKQELSDYIIQKNVANCEEWLCRNGDCLQDELSVVSRRNTCIELMTYNNSIEGGNE